MSFLQLGIVKMGAQEKLAKIALVDVLKKRRK